MAKERVRNDMRSHIAHIAARLMAEDGIEDHGLAKRKAARQAGATDRGQLPTNDEVEEALKTYQALYRQTEHRSRLKLLREKALHAMNALQQFNPYLTGSVLTGSAGKFADINLQLFTDSAKAVELYFIDRRIAYTTAQRRIFSGEEVCTVPVFTVNDDGTDIRIEVLTVQDLRRPLRATPGGKPLERAKPQAVEALLSED